MVIEKEYKIPKDLIWLADGYKHKLQISDEERYSILPCDTDNFNLLPAEQTNTFAELRVETPDHLAQPQRRVQSATYVRLQQRSQRPGTAPPVRSVHTCWGGSDSDAGSRPGSGHPTSVASFGGKPPSGQRRVHSAGSVATRARALAKMRQGFTLVNKLYENGYQSKNIALHPASPAPDYRYFDRHSRCMDHTHIHESLLWERPQTACEPGNYCHGRRPLSAASSVSRNGDPDIMDQPQRYINYHRPKTAPATRKELKYLPRSHYIFRGRQPKFCNIVQQVQLHARDLQSPSPTPSRQVDEDYDDFDYIRKSIDGDMLRRRRKHSDATRTNSGIEGRPTSPSSQDGETAKIGEDLTNLLDNPISAADTKTSGTETSVFLPNNDTEIDGTGGPPAQPPPTPEILTPKEPVAAKPAIKRPRSCTKKTKAPFTTKTRKSKAMEKKEEPVKQATPPPTPPQEETSKAEEKDIKVNIAVPDLPTYQKEEKQRKTKEKRKADRHLVVKPKVEPKDDPGELLDEELKARIREFDWSTMEMTAGSEETPRKQQKAAWVTGRLALSQQSSRFELPMDMRVLETMSTQKYIREFCKITKRRQKLYSDVFRRNAKQKERNVYILPLKDLRKALMDVLVNTLTDDHYTMLVNHMNFSPDDEIDIELFSSMSALAERLMYPEFVTQETVDMPDYMKEKIECADFGALRWKMQGVNVNPAIRKLLLQLS